MVQVGMNERTKKTPCKPENVLGKIPFYQNQIGFPANRQTKGTTQKSTATHRISKFKMIIHLDRFIFLHKSNTCPKAI
jgi:hypothetical protein